MQLLIAFKVNFFVIILVLYFKNITSFYSYANWVIVLYTFIFDEIMDKS